MTGSGFSRFLMMCLNISLSISKLFSVITLTDTDLRLDASQPGLFSVITLTDIYLSVSQTRPNLSSVINLTESFGGQVIRGPSRLYGRSEM